MKQTFWKPGEKEPKQPSPQPAKGTTPSETTISTAKVSKRSGGSQEIESHSNQQVKLSKSVLSMKVQFNE